jgi:ATP-dependent Clp protease ATP-binding subunit ClpA
MNLDKFTLKAQEAITNSINLAKGYGHQAILPEHILYSLLSEPQGIATQIFLHLAVDTNDLNAKIKEFLISQPKVYAKAAKDVYASQRAAEILNFAANYSKDFGDEYVSSETLVLAIAREKGALLASYLNKQGIAIDDILRIVKELRSGRTAESPSAEETYRALEKFGRDLTDLAKRGKLDPVIGRDEEIRRVIQVLSAAQRTIRF